MLNSKENNESILLSRRGFLTIAAATVTTITLGSVFDIQPAVASIGPAIITSRQDNPPEIVICSYPVFTNDMWFPYKEEVSPFGTLYDKGGPFDTFDQAYGTRTREVVEHYLKSALIESDQAKRIDAGELEETRSTWGFCDTSAAEANRLAKLVAEGKITYDQAHAALNNRKVFGMLVGANSGNDVYKKYPDDEQTGENNEYILEEIVFKLATPVVGQIAQIDGRVGQWFESVHGRDKRTRQMLISGFGTNGVWVPESRLIQAFISVPPDERGLYPDMDQTLFDQYAFRRFTQHIPGFTRERVTELTGIPC